MATADQKTAFVTGASSGIGRATAEAFVRRGYATVLVDYEEAAGRRAQDELRALGECRFIRADVTRDEDVAAAVDQAVAAYGRLDAAFNAAGISGDAALTGDQTLENWNRVIAVDLLGVWLCMRHQLRHMTAAGRGAIVNCASTAGIRGAAHLSPYVAAKHGVIGLTKTAAIEYVRLGVRVNAVCPGMTATPMTAGLPPDLAKSIIDASPAGRFGQPSEIGAAVLWLCDDSASFVTGEALVVDGGLTLA